jgi:hypothetical protein
MQIKESEIKKKKGIKFQKLTRSFLKSNLLIYLDQKNLQTFINPYILTIKEPIQNIMDNNIRFKLRLFLKKYNKRNKGNK